MACTSYKVLASPFQPSLMNLGKNNEIWTMGPGDFYLLFCKDVMENVFSNFSRVSTADKTKQNKNSPGLLPILF